MLDGRFRFENYVVGAANRLAASAARAVADTPGVVYNPLFIYSSSGLGKTHLLCALGVAVKRLHPGLIVEYTTLDDFVDQLHGAIASGQADAFKRRYQGIGVLLLDDVQFLTGRPETQSEILRILNALQAGGRQVVMTSDRPPNEIADVDQRLLTRLSGGLIVDIGAPDYETRVAILRHKCQERGATFAPGVLEDLARGAATNVRELQGTLNRLIAQQAILDTPIGAAEARVLLGAASGAPAPNEFESFLSEVAVVVAKHVEGWRTRLAQRIAHWNREGFRTTLLQRALEAGEPVDPAALETSFARTVELLRALEREAVQLNPAHAGSQIFRDPEGVADAEALVQRELAGREPLPAPNEDLTFASFAVTTTNEVALHAAQEVVHHPGTRYNPFVIVGPQGAGKSHLAHAVANALQQRRGRLSRVACVIGSDFVDELIAALQQGGLERWRAKYRACEAFVLDGFDAVADKELTQDELFHLFNALAERGAQLVFTARQEPAQLTTLAARLRSRLEGGLVVQITREAVAGEPVRAAAVANRLTPNPRGAAEGPATAPAVMEGVADAFFLDAEKVVLDWNDVEGRLVEELR
ncbi:MAG: DnaA ATPase domain-containing protein [Gemmatimonadaceae bacterium]